MCAGVDVLGFAIAKKCILNAKMRSEQRCSHAKNGLPMQFANAGINPVDGRFGYCLRP